jgi:hypothetical protein
MYLVVPALNAGFIFAAISWHFSAASSSQIVGVRRNNFRVSS